MHGQANIKYTMYFRQAVGMEQLGPPLNEFSLNFIFEDFSEVRRKNPNFIDIWHS